jgi:hypothetical protein
MRSSRRCGLKRALQLLNRSGFILSSVIWQCESMRPRSWEIGFNKMELFMGVRRYTDGLAYYDLDVGPLTNGTI